MSNVFPEATSTTLTKLSAIFPVLGPPIPDRSASTALTDVISACPSGVSRNS
ncbi:Uncharacterised protein [Mycobacteroides abscessus subsp. abscessus]|nr:Uncharacterised protein [Mycobacteroides abscessus subsp. abscessus]